MKRLSLLTLIILTFFTSKAKAQTYHEAFKQLPIPEFSNENDRFGDAVAIDGNYAVVGAPRFNGNQGYVNVLQLKNGKWVSVAKLTASNASSNWYFGSKVDISADVIVVGTTYQDYFSSKSNLVYVFEKPKQGWKDATETAILEPSDSSNNNGFCQSLCINKNQIAVCSKSACYIFEKPAGGWKNGNETNKLKVNGITDPVYFGCEVKITDNLLLIGDARYKQNGAVFVFEKPESGWCNDSTQTAVLTASDGGKDDYFGRSIGIDNNVIIVGACGHFVNGYNAGAIYIFEKKSNNWKTATENAILTAKGNGLGSWFGFDVDIENDVITASSPGFGDVTRGYLYTIQKPASGWASTNRVTAMLKPADIMKYGIKYYGYSIGLSNSTIIAGSSFDYDNGKDAGAVYFFNKPTDQWKNAAEDQKLLPTPYLNNTSDRFASSVDISGDYAVIGSPATVNGLRYSGSAFVFHYTGSAWEKVATLRPSDGDRSEWFGRTVAMKDDVIAVSALGRTSSDLDKVYIFKKPKDEWKDTIESCYLFSKNTPFGSYFGYAIDISNDLIAIGAPGYSLDYGRAFLYEKPSTGWKTSKESAILSSTDSLKFERFGCSVCIHENTIAVGGYHNNLDTINSAAAYIFEKPENGWQSATETAKLQSIEDSWVSTFSANVALSDSLLVLGDYGKEVAYLFNKPVGGWQSMTETTKLSLSNNGKKTGFGCSVAIDNDTIVIGANKDGGIGSVNIFIKEGDSWNDISDPLKIIATNAMQGANFGGTLAISGAAMLVGASKDVTNLFESGAAYLFIKSGKSYSSRILMNSRVDVWPNPTNGVVNIESNQQITQIVIYDVLGAYISSIKKPSQVIDLSFLHQGQYIISTESQIGKRYCKLIKK